jgi:hypothetical protein
MKPTPKGGWRACDGEESPAPRREVRGRWQQQRHRWNTRQIDSRSVAITNKPLLNGWVADYGEDSDFVRVRVRGIFPRASSTQFIGRDLVDGAVARNTGEKERASGRTAAVGVTASDRHGTASHVVSGSSTGGDHNRPANSGRGTTSASRNRNRTRSVGNRDVCSRSQCCLSKRIACAVTN